ncbi:hypothetical protein D3C87_1407160 [compost metagenome]
MICLGVCPGANGIAANTIGRPLARGGACESAQRLLGHVVVHRIGVGVDAV